MVALVAVAIGAAVGLSGKPTPLERQVMQPARDLDRMLEQAQTLAKGLATTVAATAATAIGDLILRQPRLPSDVALAARSLLMESIRP
jgi:hypothetical protein